jgi:hypothetical protein
VLLYTLRSQLRLLIDDVTALVASGSLTTGQVDGLLDKLSAATAALNEGALVPYASSGYLSQSGQCLGILTPQVGQPMVDAATVIPASNVTPIRRAIWT